MANRQAATIDRLDQPVGDASAVGECIGGEAERDGVGLGDRFVD